MPSKQMEVKKSDNTGNFPRTKGHELLFFLMHFITFIGVQQLSQPNKAMSFQMKRPTESPGQ